MINLKIEQNLVGENYWPKIASVFIAGIKEEKSIPENISEEEKEGIIQSWKNVAVLKITSEKPVKFYIGYATKDVISYLDYEFESDTKIGMRVGDGDVQFIALPKNLADKVQIELVEIVKEGDNNYKDLILV